MSTDLQILTIPKNFDHKTLLACVEALNHQFPFLQYSYLGTSILGRGIPLLRLGIGKKAVLYVGAHHGMEWITSLVLMRYVKELCECVQRKSAFYQYDAEFFLQTYSVYVIPMLNPDGVEYQIHGITSDNPLLERVRAMNGTSDDFYHWQANARGVDLNHNYDAGFAEYKVLEAENGILGGAPTRFSGETPESEPEVASLCNFIRFHNELCGVLTLHTQGKEIYYQSGGVELPKTRSVAQKLSKLCGYRISDTEGLASYGGLTDWCVQRMGLPSFTLECGKGVNPLPLSQFFPIYTDLRRLLFTFPVLLS